MSKTHTHQFRLTLASLLVAAIFALACSSGNQTATPTASVPANETYEVTDEAGARVRVPLRAQRIITLAPNLTEIVYALGAGDRLVGNTTYCNYPEQANQVTKVGDTLQPNIERIIALRPELILVSTASQLETFTKQLDERGIAVFVTDPHDLEGVFGSIKTIGHILGQEQQAEMLLKDLRVRAEAIEEAVRTRPVVKVFYQVSPSPLWTAGRKAWVTDLIRRAGGKSVTGDIEGEWMRYSDEAALASQPEAIIMATSGEKMEVAPALLKSPAVRNKRVYEINGDYLSRPGPRLIIGLEHIARVLHPEAYPQSFPR